MHRQRLDPRDVSLYGERIPFVVSSKGIRTTKLAHGDVTVGCSTELRWSGLATAHSVSMPLYGR